MPPSHGLVHLKEYDIKDSNVELIGTALDHGVKYASAATEPAWNDGRVGAEPGLRVWRIEDFEVVPWPARSLGTFYEGDSYIVLSSVKVGKKEAAAGGDDEEAPKKLAHDVYFLLGAHTSQDEAGVAAYKTMELDEFLSPIAAGAVVQHRELQASVSPGFAALFPQARLTFRRGGVRSGFTHVEPNADDAPSEVLTLLRVFKPDGAGATVVAHEVEPAVASLDDGDVFILDADVAGGRKIWVWQGSGSTPTERARAAAVVHDLTLERHVDVEVVAQGADSRAGLVVKLLRGGEAEERRSGFSAPRPGASSSGPAVGGGAVAAGREKRLFRLSDASGTLTFTPVAAGDGVNGDLLDGADVFVLDDGGRGIWVWEGKDASEGEKSRWMKVAHEYVLSLADELGGAAEDAYKVPIAKVRQGCESRAFLVAVQG